MVLRANGEARIFSDTFLTGGRAVLARKKANFGSCVPIRKKDENGYVEFKIAQKALMKARMAKEQLLRNPKQACEQLLARLFWIQRYIQEKEQQQEK